MRKHHDQRELGEVWIYFRLQFYIHSPSQRQGKARQERGAGADAESMEKLLVYSLRPAKPAFLKSPEPPAQGWHLPTVDWALPHQ